MSSRIYEYNPTTLPKKGQNVPNLDKLIEQVDPSKTKVHKTETASGKTESISLFYDKDGNKIGLSKRDMHDGSTSYLIRSEDPQDGATVAYDYDNDGNIDAYKVTNHETGKVESYVDTNDSGKGNFQNLNTLPEFQWYNPRTWFNNKEDNIPPEGLR